MSDATTPTGSKRGAAPDDLHDNSDVEGMGYEQARDELTAIVATLEGGRAPLEESMRLWERGEALAEHCQRWLDGAQQRIDDAVARRNAETSGSSGDKR